MMGKCVGDRLDTVPYASTRRMTALTHYMAHMVHCWPDIIPIWIA
jgi:hypothetical protein